MAYIPLTPLVQQFFDNLGDPLVSGTLNAYVAGTSTPTNFYSDSTGTIAGSSITLDSRGEPTTIKLLWVDTAVVYKFVLKDSTGTTIWTEDNISVTEVTDGSVTEAKLATGAVTAAKIGAGAVTTSKLADSAVTAAKISQAVQFGYRNRIINGNMFIDQRNSGASKTFTAAAAAAYSVDRWHAKCTGANITGQRIKSGGRYFYRFTGATSNTGLEFGQRIETVNSQDMAGQTCVLSAKISSTSLTSITWTAYYANTDDTFSSKTQIATGTFTITSTEATYSASMSVPSAATTGIEIVFSTGALLGSQTLTITDVQFELGPTATNFEFRHYTSELSLAQRYYWRANEFSSGQVGSYATNTLITTTISCPVDMRIEPTTSIVKTNTTATNVQISSINAYSVGTRYIRLTASCTAISASVEFNSGSGDYVDASSEL